MRMLPDRWTSGTVYSERRVFEALADMDLIGVALHSLNLPEHEYKLTGEVDFVLILESMILVVEVKGAQVACRDGVWHYQDRRGHHRTSLEGPFKQAQSGMYALRKGLEETLEQADTATIAYGYLVITPDVVLPKSAEWPEEAYIGRSRFTQSGGLRQAIDGAADYWRAKQRWAKDLDRGRRQRVVNQIRPDFDRVPSLAARAEEADAVFEKLTQEQFERLDLVLDNDRVLVEGGAGTGKTFLAIETARRLARQGEVPLFVARSPKLVEFIRGRLGADSLQAATPEEAIAKGLTGDRLVIDEGQDLLNLEGLGQLDQLVAGGLSDGRWVMFFDPNRQAHLYADHDPEALGMLRTFGPARARLKENCRNTPEIALFGRLLTGADVGVAVAGSGPKVVQQSVDDKEDEAAELDAWIGRLLDQDVPLADITIVSLAGVWAESSARHLGKRLTSKLVQIDSADIAGWPPKTLTWASAVDIKGLENRFVAIIDVDELESEAAIDRLYVGMTRPRTGLFVAFPARLDSRLRDLIAANAASVAMAGEAQRR